ncbi:uncharacterized protein LOC121289292 [Carcharodon carcharias]
MKTLLPLLTPGEMTRDVIAPLSEAKAPPEARGKCPRVVFYWFLVIMITMAQVLAGSCLSFYFLSRHLENAIPKSEKCITHWIAASRSQQRIGENQILAWETSVGNVYTGTCTTYNETENSLEINMNGFYFIYIQVMLEGNWKNVELNINNQSTEHSQSSGAPHSNTVYFGSTHKLRAGTKILVKLNPDRVLAGETQTFLSLFQL